MLDQNGKRHTPRGPHGKNTNSELSFYWQYYGLTQDPFPAISDASMYFPLPQWEHHLDLIQHLIKNENVLLAAIGGEGSGKTTFSKQIQQAFNEGYSIHQFEADSLFSTRKLVRELETGFDLKARPNEAPEEQLDGQIAEVQHAQQPCLLIIDDAHFLPLETLNSLLFLLKQQSKNQMRLHIVLFGDKNLQAKLSNLAMHELSGEMIHSIEISPLTLEETKQYLTYRLNRAGLSGPMPLSQMSIEKIYANSDGLPDRINRSAQQLLLDDLSKQRSLAAPSLIKKHQTKIIGGCLLAVALVAASYVLDKQGEHSISHPQASQPVISFAKQDQTMQAPVQQAKTKLEPHAITAAQQIQTAANKSVAETPAQPVVRVAKHVVETKPTSKVVVSAKVETSKIPAAAPEAKVLAAKQKPVTHKVAVKKAAKPIRLAKLETVSAIPAQQPYHVDIIKHPKLVKTFDEKVMGTKAKPASDHKAEAKAVIVSHAVQEPALAKTLRAKGLKLTKGEDSLLKDNSNDYTLQVIGLSYEKSMLKFIRENHLQGDTHYVATKLHGKPWFILVYGVYNTRLQATKAIKELPAALKSYKPWPRQLKYVKTDIDRG